MLAPALLAILPVLVSAQSTTTHAASSAPAAPAPASSTIAAVSTPAGAVSTPAVSGGISTSGSSISLPPTVPITLISTNPTAFPLSYLIPGASTQATVPLFETFAAGAQPTLIPGAPPLPNIATISPGMYPALDTPPPTNSSEVQAWIAQVQSSGISIPGLTPSLPGGCPANPDLIPQAGSTGRCWWTCGQCSRASDITTCPDQNTWGLSFDDGPSPYTPDLLNYLNQQNLKSTFFIVGSRAISRPQILQTEYMAGHQLSVHTWSHTPLTTQTTEEIIAELGWTAKVIRDITGVTPNTMRPPYGDIDDRVRAIAMAMGLTPIIWTGISNNGVNQNFDTGDFTIDAGTISASGVIANFDRILSLAPTLATGFIVLAHDLFQQTVDLATGYIIPDALARKNPSFTLEPIITCLRKPLADAYVETNNNVTNPPPNAGGVGGATTLSPTQSGAIGGPSSAANRRLDTTTWVPFGAVAMAVLSTFAGAVWLVL